MVEIDERDEQILQLLIEDSKRTYADIGEEVALSPPAVSNRIDQLRELGIIRRFTVDVDNSMLATGDATLVDVQLRPDEVDEVVDVLRGHDAVEYLIQTDDAHVTLLAHAAADELRAYVGDALEDQTVLSYDVRNVVETEWNPRLGSHGLTVECVECGKPIRGEGTTIQTDERTYFVCCSSCESVFRDRYERFSSGAKADEES